MTHSYLVFEIANLLHRPVNVNPLIVETPEEKHLYAMGERNSKIRKERRDTSLLKHTPNDLESDIIHAFWQKQLQYHGILPERTSKLPR
jgi:hypothetical protein